MSFVDKIRTWKGQAKAAGGDAGLQPLDLVVSGISSAVAVYAAGASLSSDKNAAFFTAIVIAGTVLSLFIVRFMGRSKFLQSDTIAYTLVAVAAGLGIGWFNDLCPDPIYTEYLTTAGVLSWMLALGTATVWRDQTMLFQAVPAVALFGLVGCYDTFRASVLYFFVFLICQAILLSRAHGRAMLRQAQSSSGEALEMSAMRQGPWRWMAGPEWALGSALTIVLVSAIGAPILRESASGFSGLVKYAPPVSALVASSVSGVNMNGTRVGTGPNSVRNNPVLRATLPEPLYLRGFVFGPYQHGMWMPGLSAPQLSTSDPMLPRPGKLGLSNMTDQIQVDFRIEPIEIFNAIVPAPGEVVSLTDESMVYQRNMGGSFSARPVAPYPPLEGKAVLFGGKTSIKDAATQDVEDVAPDWVQTQGLPEDVAAWARKVTKDAKTDYDKAIAIKHAIEGRAKYNLGAGATPNDVDPVSYFLFTSKEGYCDLFASAMVIMARAVGLPARYVTGYYPFGSDQDDQGRYIVREKDAHAWCEILFKNAGWVVFDATEGAASVEGGGLGSANDHPFWRNPWMLSVLGIGACGGLGYFAVNWGVGIRRRRMSPRFAQIKANRAASKFRRQIGGQYLAFEREIRKAAKRPRRASETISEYLEAARDRLGAASGAATQTSSAFSAALYAPSQIDPAILASLKQKVKMFKQVRRGRAS